MLTGRPELGEALEGLDPTHRALLELSLHREVADPALAELLRSDVDSVARQRGEALEQLAGDLDASPDEVESELIRFWREEPEAEPETPEDEPETPEASPQSSVISHQSSPTEPRRPRRGIWAGVVALAATGLVLTLALSGGDDEESEPADGGPPPAELGEGGDPPPGQRGTEPIPLAALAGSRAGGTARVVERDGAPTLELRLRGLGKGVYGVWLYNSIGDARQLASARGPAPSVSARLPEDYTRYRYVDVSREPGDGNPNHSGASVLRIPTADLPRG